MRPTLLACTLIALACQSSPAEDSPQAQLGKSFRLAVGSSVLLPDLNWRVTFVEVLGDSRCPRGVQCVWAGEAKILLEVERDGKAARHELTTQKEETMIGGRSCSLKSVDPYPESTEPIAPESYSIELEIASEASRIEE